MSNITLQKFPCLLADRETAKSTCGGLPQEDRGGIRRGVERSQDSLAARGCRGRAIGSCGLIRYRVSILPDQKNFGDCLYNVNVHNVPNCATKTG